MKAKRPMPAPATRTEDAALPDSCAPADSELDGLSLLLSESLLSLLLPLLLLLPDPEPLLPVEPALEPPVVTEASVGFPPMTTVDEGPTEIEKEVKPAVPL